jgi:N-acetylneuraminate synthase
MKCIIVAEIGINHNGDVELAKQMIDAAAVAGVDSVKFQKRTISAVYTPEELDRFRESPWGKTNRAQKEGLEFGQDEYDEIDRHCAARGIRWFASPWDVKSVEFLQRYDLPYTKIASASITDFDLLGAIKDTGRPVILSTGMSTRQEVRKAVEYLGNRVKYILACTSTYPTKNEEVNLGFLRTLQEEYPTINTGFSNHHPGILFAAASTVLGAEMVEFHMTLDRASYGSDQAASIEIPGVLKLVKYIRGLEQALGTGEWTVFDSEEMIKAKLRRN